MSENAPHLVSLDRPRFCSTCGGPLGDPESHGGWPCLSCGRPSFLDPKVAACTVPWWQDKIVLVRRAIEPRRGFWASPGGYCARGEAPSAAAARETLEEAGLVVVSRELLGVFSYPGSPVIVIYYDCEIVSDTPPVADPAEVLEIGLFSPDEVPWDELAFPSVHEGLRAAIAHRRTKDEGP